MKIFEENSSRNLEQICTIRNKSANLKDANFNELRLVEYPRRGLIFSLFFEYAPHKITHVCLDICKIVGFGLFWFKDSNWKSSIFRAPLMAYFECLDK